MFASKRKNHRPARILEVHAAFDSVGLLHILLSDHLGRRPRGNQSSLVQHKHVIGVGSCLGQIVQNGHDRTTFIDQVGA